MKVLHLSYSAPPDPPGGTEIYVTGLCRALSGHGVQTVVAAPGSSDAAFDADGLTIRRFSYAGRTTLEELYGAGDALAAESFGRVLDREAPDVVQQHAWTPACSLEAARRVKRRGIPFIFSYHTPTVSCARGTLLKWGRDPCDGRLDAAECSRCVLEARGLPRVVGSMVSALGAVVGGGLEAAGAAGGPLTALRLPQLIERQQRALGELFALADAIVAPTEWVRDLLVRNGVPADKIVFSRHGVVDGGQARSLRIIVPGAPLRLVHLGRLDPTKGTHVLLAALRRCPAAPLELDIYGIEQGAHARTVRDELQRLSSADRRIRFLPPIAHGDVVRTLGHYDAVVVPSQLLETGPLVVTEAFAAGIAVIGSRLGGIAASVRSGVDGLLVERFDAPESWATVLDECAANPGLLRRLKSAVRPPREMAAVAEEMLMLYRRLVGESVAPGRA
jgi:glycosyltransferase involved in cell wall biosynthesis